MIEVFAPDWDADNVISTTRLLVDVVCVLTAVTRIEPESCGLANEIVSRRSA
jgi:hypothetical protein